MLQAVSFDQTVHESLDDESCFRVLLASADLQRCMVAHAFLAKLAKERNLGLSVETLSTIKRSWCVPDEALAVLGEMGITIPDCRRTLLDEAAIRKAHLVLGMARKDVRAAISVVPDAWTRIFTLKEFVTRGEERGPCTAGERLDRWLALLGGARSYEELLFAYPPETLSEQVPDTPEELQVKADELWDLVCRLVDLIAVPTE